MQRDIPTEFKELRLSGMAAAWQELTTHEGKYTDVDIQTSRWLIEHLLQAEHAHRAFASVRHQMKAAKFPLHRDLAGFDFEGTKVDQKLVKQLSTLAFTDTAQNVVLIGGPGTGKTHLAVSIGKRVMRKHGASVLFVSVQRAIRSIKDTWARGSSVTEAQAVALLTFPDLLILDEVGVQHGSEYERQVLFDVLNERYETRKPTLFLSNKTLDEFKVVMGERVMDRLREDGAPVVPFCWPSARGRALR